MKTIICTLIVCLSLSFIPLQAEAGEGPSFTQCQAEPSKGTGWGTFWTYYGIINAASGGAMLGSEDQYGITRGTAIGAIVVGGLISGMGMRMTSNANTYNEACEKALSGLNLEPSKKATGVDLVYRW